MGLLFSAFLTIFDRSAFFLQHSHQVYGDVFFAAMVESVLFFGVTLDIFKGMGEKND
jgi:hypothetical protein